MPKLRSAAYRRRRAARQRKAYVAKRAAPRHPFLTLEQRGCLRDSMRVDPEELPDRSEYGRDPDRQAAIEGHRRRVAGGA